MNADINTNKKFQAIIKELFIRCRILNITLVFIMQSYFSVLKDVRLNSMHYLIMKIHNKRELQNIGFNHSADIDSKDFVKIYRKLVYIAMPMYKLIEYSDNYSDTSGSLAQFKRDEPPADNTDMVVNNNHLNSQSFKYKAALVGKTIDAANENSFVKKHKNSCSIKIFKQILEITENVTN